MGELKIGPTVEIEPRKHSKGLFTVIMDKINGDTLEELWPTMDFDAKKNAATQIKAIIEKAGKDGYKLLDNNPGNFILR